MSCCWYTSWASCATCSGTGSLSTCQSHMRTSFTIQHKLGLLQCLPNFLMNLCEREGVLYGGSRYSAAHPLETSSHQPSHSHQVA